MARKRNSEGETMTKIIKDVFDKNKAYTPDTAVPISAFKDVKLTSHSISYTIANLMQDGVVIKTGDDRYYFSLETWKTLEKKVMKGYWFLILLPLIVLIVFLVVLYGGDLSSALFR